MHPLSLYIIIEESPNGFVFMIEGNQEKKVYGGGPWWKPAMQIFSEISTWIAAPIILAVIAGKALDNHFGTTQSCLGDIHH